MAGPVALGWAAGDMSAGLIATIGSFTALYGSDRPYASRAVLLAGIAFSFALIVSVGVYVRHPDVLAIAILVPLAAGATFLCNVLAVGPPGAYMLILAGATGTTLSTIHGQFWQIGLLVLAGGAFSWLVQMAGVLLWPRGPERAAVAAAAAAVARFAETVTTAQHNEARHAAALALHQAWTSLVAFQPQRRRADASLSRLRGLNRELHVLFAQAIHADMYHESRSALAAQARKLGERVAFPERTPARRPVDGADLPLSYSVKDNLRDAIKWGSTATVVTLRVTAAATLAGIIGAALGLERTYWIMAAAILVLYQGLDWTRTLQRGLEQRRRLRRRVLQQAQVIH